MRVSSSMRAFEATIRGARAAGLALATACAVLSTSCSNDNTVSGSNAVAVKVKKTTKAAVSTRDQGNASGGGKIAVPVPQHDSMPALPGITQPLVRVSVFEALERPAAQALAAAGRPVPVVLDSQALTARFLAVFGPNGRSNSQSTDRNNIEAGQIFSARQRQILGDYNLMGNAQTFRSMQRRSVDQEYLQTVRDYLSDACGNLVAAEMATPSAATNRIVADPAPDAARLSAFMSALYGHAPTAGALHAGAQRYADAMATLGGSLPPPGNARNTAIRNNSIVLCVTLGTDPRVYLR